MNKRINYVSPAEALQMRMADGICATLFGPKPGPNWDSWHALVEQINTNKAFFATPIHGKRSLAGGTVGR